MHNITEVTRRDIIDIIRNGFVGNEPQTKLDYYEREYVTKVQLNTKYVIMGGLKKLIFYQGSII